MTLSPRSVVAAVALACSACGSSGGGPSTPLPPCEAAVATLCERACACAPDGTCRVALGAVEGTITGFDTYKGRKDCEDSGRSILGCPYGRPGLDNATCHAAARSAACIDVTDGRTSTKAYRWPKDCRMP